jgi:hypothetical protein
MPLQATSGAASYDAFGGGVPVIPNYIEEVFSTYLYTGNGSTQTITNGIDLAGKGGLVWIKGRSGATDNALYDTVRGATKDLVSNTSGAETTQATGLTSFATTGFSIGALAKLNTSSATYASWTFREQPKFFDVVTYTGTGSNRTIAHNLGSVPGCIIVKCTSNASTEWFVYHRSLTSANYHIRLDQTNAEISLTAAWNDTPPTSSVFTLGTDDRVNGSGRTYVAYLFAHNAGGFGLTGTDNVISCGSASATGVTAVTLGYEPQFCMLKRSSGTGGWFMTDTMRGWNMQGDVDVRANVADAETDRTGSGWFPSATGFTFDSAQLNGSGDYIYIAIRRGPMKVPTTGTSVFAPVARAGTNSVANVTSGFPTDLFINLNRDHLYFANNPFFDRLRGLVYSNSNSTAAETDGSPFLSAYGNTGVTLTNSGLNSSATTYITYSMGRAPGFFDEVCYTGTGSATTVAHNLAAVPELMIVKSRSNGGGGYEWAVYSSGLTSAGYYLILNTTAAENLGTAQWNSTAPTSSVFSVGTSSRTNGSGVTYVNYLFATCPGVSKVGSYTGTGATQVINCGFTGGARFVLIKSTSTTGNWYVWDSARGIVAGNDPYLELNTVNAEVTGTDWVDTAASGFELSNSGGNLANSNGVSYIFLAIA